MVTEGESIVMDDESIHSLKNPSPGRSSSSLHVYGGDLVGTATAMCCDLGLSKQSFRPAPCDGILGQGPDPSPTSGREDPVGPASRLRYLTSKWTPRQPVRRSL